MSGDSVCDVQAGLEVVGAYVGPDAYGKWRNLPPRCSYQAGHGLGHSWEYDRCSCPPGEGDVPCMDVGVVDGLCTFCARSCAR